MPLPLVNLTDDELFPCLNGVLVGYMLLLFAPRWKHTAFLTLSIVFLYSLLYTALVFHRLLLSTSTLPDINFNTLDAIAHLFAERDVVMAGWTHYIGLDLLVARYAVLDAQNRGISHWWMFIIVPVCLFAAPVAFVLYFVSIQVQQIATKKTRLQ